MTLETKMRGFMRNCIFKVNFFAINLRNHGPDRPDAWIRSTSLGLKERFDVDGAIIKMAEEGYEEFGFYGHSLGGAADTNALGMDSNKLPPNIKVKLVILEKTFAHSYSFQVRTHQNLFSNLHLNMKDALPGGAEQFRPYRIMPPSYFQSDRAVDVAETLANYNANENDPANVIGNINAPILLIFAKGGDSFMTEDDMDDLAKNARQPYKLPVKSSYTDMGNRHEAELNNLTAFANMLNFCKMYL